LLLAVCCTLTRGLHTLSITVTLYAITLLKMVTSCGSLSEAAVQNKEDDLRRIQIITDF